MLSALKVVQCTCDLQEASYWVLQLETLLEQKGVTPERFLEAANGYLKKNTTGLKEFKRTGLWGRLQVVPNTLCVSTTHLLEILKELGIPE